MQSCVLFNKEDMRLVEREEIPLGPTEVRISTLVAGICGSDIHYYHDARVANFFVKEPLALGHEACGKIVEIGKVVNGFAIGDTVVINPGRTCHQCSYCLSGRENLCPNILFMGSASHNPHIQGTFQERFVVDVEQCFRSEGEASHEALAFAEPLSIALHAINRAGSVFNKKLLIVGAGAVGLLCAMVARMAGAKFIATTDRHQYPLKIARQIGVDLALDVVADAEIIDSWKEKGEFDVVIEASGTPPGLMTALLSAGRGARIVEVGILPSGLIDIPYGVMFSRELEIAAALRQNRVFGSAVDMIEKNRIDVMPLLSYRFPIDEFEKAFLLAEDRNKTIKVQLSFGG